jgi:hypothetical protein
MYQQGAGVTEILVNRLQDDRSEIVLAPELMAARAAGFCNLSKKVTQCEFIGTQKSFLREPAERRPALGKRRLPRVEGIPQISSDCARLPAKRGVYPHRMDLFSRGPQR